MPTRGCPSAGDTATLTSRISATSADRTSSSTIISRSSWAASSSAPETPRGVQEQSGTTLRSRSSALPPVRRDACNTHAACATTHRDGSQPQVAVRIHPDWRVQAVVEQTREAEMIQAIDRLRVIHSEREKTVYILCNI